jgi:hypothetical protein
VTVALFPGVDFDVIPTTKSNTRDKTENAVISLLFTAEDLIGSDDGHQTSLPFSVTLFTMYGEGYQIV